MKDPLDETTRRAGADAVRELEVHASPEVPQPMPPPKRKFGAMKGEIHIGPEFFEPLPEEELRAWEGGE